MHKKILEHQQLIKTEITKFEHELKNTKTDKEIESLHRNLDELIKYHAETVHDFQHERLIHLIVTFFFGSLLLLSISIIFVLTLTPITYNLFNILILLIGLILFITEIFYVKHYYDLENGTQKLYELTKKLYELAATR